MDYLRANLGFKGERGYSAYEIAVQNGFIGSEKQWLASIGTTNSFTGKEAIYTTQSDNESVFNLPSEYTSNSVLDVYLDGVRLTNTMYSIDANSRTITLKNPVVKGTQIEIEVLTIISTELPISDELNSASTNDTTAGSKAVYDFVNEKIATSESTTNSKITTGLATKINNSDVVVTSGSVQNIAANETKTVDLYYPSGFNKSNTHIIGKMTSNNNVYYDSVDLTPTANGFPVIKMIALLDDVIRVWLTNTNSSTAKIGYYKITLLKK
jgi:hypothetical protein